MDRTTLARTGIAGAVAGLGLAVGGVAMASADSDATSASAGARYDGHARGGHVAEVLAEELGLDQDVVEDALEAVHDELHADDPDTTDGTRPDPPTEEEQAEREAAFTAALAEELDVSEAKVAAALDVLRAEAEAQADEMRAEGRELLVERLDAAVEDGTLTEADKKSVLKAYDADVIGGFGGGFGMHGGPHGPGPDGFRAEEPTT